MKGPTSQGGEAIVPNLQRSSCCEGTFQHSGVYQCPGKDLQCQASAVVPSHWIGAQKLAGGKALIRPFLASGLYLLHCVVKSSWQAVDSWKWGEGAFFPLLATCPLIKPFPITANTTVCDSQSWTVCHSAGKFICSHCKWLPYLNFNLRHIVERKMI